jgi:branched-chain amino acid aminotransferase/4-amino-4-deoxychorismate lyase
MSTKLIHNFSVIEGLLPNDFWQNRAFQYGDGLFETIMMRNGTVRFLADHFERLTGGMGALGMDVPEGFTPGYLRQAIEELALQNNLGGTARIKIHVWRSPGGLYTPESRNAEFMISLTALSQKPAPFKKKAIFYEDIRLSASAISRFKTMSALPYVMAGLARRQAGADEVILLDVYGHLAECGASNLLWLKEGTLYTPSVATGCIEGVMLKQIIRLARTHGLAVKQDLSFRDELFEADAVLCCNVAGVQFIENIAGYDLRKEPTPELRWLLDELG